ncbi:hypothetical protein LUZ63_018962 [Rhynchospora breviuscula]|uniref:F-box domain-containing protein n=1 Tax=Rhynchospora breviuscula TaxID=2022672 RepID=A0A9Q0C5B5_9POAL|nr:hypothetical protein LUZ63_018962 [Rhynchospora breviuscula]
MDWSGLPPELLHLIFTKFSSICDLIHFRAVCNTWRASASVSYLPPQIQIPCFLLEPNPGATTLQFYSLTSGKTHNVNVSACSEQTILGSSNGYLLLHHSANPNLYLLNPVTNSKLSQPVLQIEGSRLVWESPGPIRTDDYSVHVSGNTWIPNKLPAFWQPGEINRTTINEVYQRCCYHDGKYLILISHFYKSIDIYDVATRTLRSAVVPPVNEGPFFPPGASTYFVISAGQVIRVLQHDNKCLPLHQRHFLIHRLEFQTNEQNHFWVKVNNIGDQILFLNVMNGFSISAAGCSGVFRGNSIYFMKKEDTGFNNRNSYVLARYNIETGIAEELPFPPVTGGTWFLPSLQCS